MAIKATDMHIKTSGPVAEPIEGVGYRLVLAEVNSVPAAKIVCNTSIFNDTTSTFRCSDVRGR